MNGGYKKAIDALCAMLPAGVVFAIYRYLDSHDGALIEEIRLRVGGLWLTVKGKNIPLGYQISSAEMSECVGKLCGGSVYAHTPTITRGYICVSIDSAEGEPTVIRAGICGHAATDDKYGQIIGIRDVRSVNLRIPRRIYGCADALAKVMTNDNFTRNVLVYSKPGVGKTTVLRELCLTLSSGDTPKRVAVIDTRGELAVEGYSGALDILSGYPKAEGIEIAARTMGAEIIICDEIGTYEAEAVCSVLHMGVCVVMSVHADSYDELIKRMPVKMLINAGTSCICAGLSRSDDGLFVYSFGEIRGATASVL